MKGAENLYPAQFYEFCRKHREDRTCNFYTNVFDKKNALTTEALVSLGNLKDRSPLSVEEVMDLMKNAECCPYEMSSLLGKDANVVIADYFHVLSPTVCKNFFRRINTTCDDCIIIFDEAHHLPQRCRDLLSSTITSFALKAAIKEAVEACADDIATNLRKLQNIIDILAKNCSDEKKITKDQLMTSIEMNIGDYNSFIISLTMLSDAVKEEKKRSFIASIASFLEAWQGDDVGFVRYLSKGFNNRITVQYKCLDPRFIMRPILEEASTVIAMSATLEPMDMYQTILGFPKESMITSYPSPFNNNQRLTMIVPETTTKYNQRSPEQFKRIAKIVAEITDCIPGNCAVFFPSYSIRDQVNQSFQTLTKKTVFQEQRQLNKQQRQELLDRFKQYKNSGAVLLGIMGGSFAEGIDLPGDLLKGVVVVGVPLTRPNIETNALIAYYDTLFGKGWDYGYIMPAMTKCLQGAGRCIRTTEDKGVIIFLDSRFTWHSYYKCFPREWGSMVTRSFTEKIETFF